MAGATEDILARAATEVARIEAILAGIDEVLVAEADLDKDELSKAEEFLALERVTEAEDALVDMILDPEFADYQRHLLAGLRGLIGGAA